MFKKIKDWWNRDKNEVAQRLAKIERQLEEENLARRQAEADKAMLTQEIQMYRKRDEEDEARRNGTTPWVEIKSADFDAVKGIHIELDWNDAFIQYLKDNGIKARDEDTAVQKWLAFLYQDLIERLEQRVVDNSDKPRVNDFE